ncbi:MAG: hypothetical protein AABM33_00470 [Pseudomonadota bacterium]
MESAFEAGVPDADVQAKGTGLLEIEFEDGSKMVINRHGATGPGCLPQSRNLPRSRAERRSC